MEGEGQCHGVCQVSTQGVLLASYAGIDVCSRDYPSAELIEDFEFQRTGRRVQETSDVELWGSQSRSLKVVLKIAYVVDHVPAEREQLVAEE